MISICVLKAIQVLLHQYVTFLRLPSIIYKSELTRKISKWSQRVLGLKINVWNIQEFFPRHRLHSKSDLNEVTFIKCDRYEVTNSGILIKIVNICDLSHFMSQNYFTCLLQMFHASLHQYVTFLRLPSISCKSGLTRKLLPILNH